MTTHLPPLFAPVFSQAIPDASASLAEQEIHLWLLDLDQFTDAHQREATKIMSASEHERAQKFMRGKESYIASRWLQRKVLARYLDVAPQELEPLRSDKGKPYLPHSDMHFSLSHSGHWAVLAVGKAELLGVDLESIRSARNLPGIAQHYYHPNEQAQMQSLQGSAQADYFYRLWTLKEAFFKALGTGISAGLEKVAFEWGADTISATIDDQLGCLRDQWQFHQWALSPLDYCALAYRSAQPLAAEWFDALALPAFP